MFTLEFHVFVSAASGLLAGLAHVVSGPDHLAAIAPLAVDGRRRAWLTGLWWGIGHSSGVWIVALLALALRESLPVEWLSAWGERLVGGVLIAVGLLGMRALTRTHIHSHEHEHDGQRHVHYHMHVEGHKHPRAHAHTHGALAIGTLHGLAGTSHLLGVLPTLLLPTWADALSYVFCFGIGSIFAMTIFSWGIGRLARSLAHFGEVAYRRLAFGCCAAAIAVGFFWIYTAFTQVH